MFLIFHFDNSLKYIQNSHIMFVYGIFKLYPRDFYAIYSYLLEVSEGSLHLRNVLSSKKYENSDKEHLKKQKR